MCDHGPDKQNNKHAELWKNNNNDKLKYKQHSKFHTETQPNDNEAISCEKNNESKLPFKYDSNQKQFKNTLC